jgi:hypothetical protein
MSTWIQPENFTTSSMRSMRRLIQRPPNASPVMNALNMSSNECVVLPSTRLSILSQPISYMNDEVPVIAAAARNSVASLSSPAAFAAGAPIGLFAGFGSSFASTQTTSASATLSRPAVKIVPGRPTSAMSQNPLTSTPTAAPMLFVK